MRAGHTPLGASGSYDRRLAKHWGVEEIPSIVTRSLNGAEVVISDLEVNRPSGQLSDPLPSEDAYMICLVLRDLPNNSYWEDGRELSRYSLKRGQVAISDLRCAPAGVIDQPIHTMLFKLPRITIAAVADELNVPRVDELKFRPGLGMFDNTVMHLGLSLMPALASPDRVSRLFTDHVTLALAAHVAQTYGGMPAAAMVVTGGLAPWQEKRAKEMLACDLSGATPLHEIAAACGLSIRHFSRAFHRSTGLPPHAWLIQARVELAKSMLRGHPASLSDIARACGFADQSHFARVFMRRVGASPGAWRKTMRV
jgi:AraC-like DNA-binding protein